MTKRVRFGTPIFQGDLSVLMLGDGWDYDFDRMFRSRKTEGILWHEPLKWCGLSGTLFAQANVDKPWVQVNGKGHEQYRDWASEVVAKEILN